MNKITTLAVTILLLFTLCGCGANTPSRSVVENDIVTIVNTKISDSLDQKTNEVTEINITKQSTMDRQNITNCTFYLSNAAYKIFYEVSLVYIQDDQKVWNFGKYSIDNYEAYPLAGVDEIIAHNEIAELLGAENQEISVGYLSEKYTYDSTYQLRVTERETSLETGIDLLTFHFSKISELCEENGLIYVEYNFNSQTACWEMTLFDDSNNKIVDFYPEGQWRFAIGTYYIKIYIDDINYENNTATIYSTASPFQVTADRGKFKNGETVTFTFTEDGMEFSAFSSPDKHYNIIILLAKDNMYYKFSSITSIRPTEFTGFAPVQWYRYSRDS